MAARINNALDEMDQAMTELKDAVDGIKIRREFFRSTHKALTTAVARLTVEVADNASSLSDD
ncbi:hypothetical protein [Actinokineospora globicatena]|uniref:hypothetical protein n=1 Tax=Actinokineospora globicatena TaxID=103729 RepID=UPI0020A478CE|nr:hypothetical protein [Actinokineospora globicatena]MCP2306095.1 hypothetical protein [Actinokineospora globicatena]GLW80031.1 hypothetical protein Aglo01_45120 [Actinokineospora globicatena]GLW86860.1 hypothetical protein Aglo02_44990 [Actinokineospora globicatena]